MKKSALVLLWVVLSVSAHAQTEAPLDGKVISKPDCVASFKKIKEKLLLSLNLFEEEAKKAMEAGNGKRFYKFMDARERLGKIVSRNVRKSPTTKNLSSLMYIDQYQGLALTLLQEEKYIDAEAKLKEISEL